MAPKRTRLEIGRAIMRVAKETLVPIAELRDVAGVSERTLICWAMEGRRGVFLDAVKRGDAWFSSTDAVKRFLVEREKVENAQGAAAGG